jgi:hypothetical protein
MGVLLLLASTPCFGQFWPTTVELSVSEDYSLNGEVENLLGRELKRIGDLQVVDKKGKFGIEVIVMKMSDAVGSAKDVSVASLITNRWNGELLDSPIMGLKGKISDPSLKVYKDWFGTGITVKNFDLRVGAMRDLPVICHQIIVDFDVKTLRPLRSGS